LTGKTIGFASKLIIAIGICVSSGAVAFGLGERGALLHVVNDLCIPMQEALNVPLPCLKVDAKRGFVVLRAPLDATRILIVPTRRIEGIENPIILQDGAPNLWAIAWNERDRVTSAARRPLAWSDIGMAINSRRTRTQDQLHIHVDCVDPRLKRALASQAGQISTKWSLLNLRSWSDIYRVKSIAAAGLERDIFKMVADEIPGARSSMGLQSIAIVGHEDRNGHRGFVVLVNSNGGHAEDLLDHSCSNGIDTLTGAR
jgi:CDP-diacylglycerol pyrophosphatase